MPPFTVSPLCIPSSHWSSRILSSSVTKPPTTTTSLTLLSLWIPPTSAAEYSTPPWQKPPPAKPIPPCFYLVPQAITSSPIHPSASMAPSTISMGGQLMDHHASHAARVSRKRSPLLQKMKEEFHSPGCCSQTKERSPCFFKRGLQ